MTLTHWVLIATIVALIAYDAIVATIGQPTESQILRDWGQKRVALPFTAGFLAAHWFMNRNSQWPSGWMLALPIILALVGWDVWWNHKDRPRVWYRWPGLWLLAGLPVGCFLWGQGT